VEWRDEFLEHLKGKALAAGSINSYRISLDAFLDYLSARGIQDVREVTPAEIDRYWSAVLQSKGKITKRPLARGTINERLNVVHAYFVYLMRRKKVLLDPTRNLDYRLRVNRLPKNILNEDEMAILLEQPDTRTPLGLRDRAMMELLYSTGIRSKELFGLNMEDVDFKEENVFIRQGKGWKDRITPVGKVALQWVERYLTEARPKLQGRATALFLGRWNRERIRRTGFRDRLAAYAARARTGSRVTLHTFRHSFATHMLRAGAGLRYIQEMLGHTRASTTQIYTRVCPVDLKAVHRRCHPRGKINGRKENGLNCRKG
jgi:integrase/recombinase XerD